MNKMEFAQNMERRIKNNNNELTYYIIIGEVVYELTYEFKKGEIQLVYTQTPLFRQGTYFSKFENLWDSISRISEHPVFNARKEAQEYLIKNKEKERENQISHFFN